MSTTDLTSQLQSILSTQSTRAEIYSTLLREVSSINEVGVDQLNHYCKESIAKFQQLSKDLRALEATIRPQHPTYANMIASIQSLEQQKFKMVVSYLQQQVALFMSTCPHDHSRPLPADPSAANWRKDIFKQYLTDEEMQAPLLPDDETPCNDKACSNTALHSLADHSEATSSSNNKLKACTHPHHHQHDDEYDPFEAQQQLKLQFVAEVAELDSELNDIVDEIRAELMDLVD